MKGERRKTRILAFQSLYEIDSVGHDAVTVMDNIQARNLMSPENAEFYRKLVSGVIKNREIIDNKIKEFAPAFPPAQISVTDRNVLRLAIFEILLDNKTPVKVAIDEAIEIAKKFGSEKSSKFINGVLGSISTLVNKENNDQ